MAASVQRGPPQLNRTMIHIRRPRVSPDVIYQWKRRGKIRPVSCTGWPTYQAMDVLQAEAATRRRARSTSGSPPCA